MEKPLLSRATFVFVQDGNTCGTTDETEELIIEVESSSLIDGPDDCFFVLKTPTGWSLDNIKELSELIDRCKRSL
jgi:hypothetical protein